MLRAFAVVTVSIAFPLMVTSIGLDADVLAIGGGVGTTIGFICLAWSFDLIRRAWRRIGTLLEGTFTQSLLASSLTFASGLGVALTWSWGLFPRMAFGAAGLFFVNWWMHVLGRTGLSRLRKENRALKRAVQVLETQVESLVPAGEENDRIRAIVQHALNVLLGLEAAKEGRTGVDELGPRAWIEHVCLRTTRDVLQQASASNDYKIELGILRVPNEVVYVDMAAGPLLKEYKDYGGCPVAGVPDSEAIAKILESKEIQGGFVDSDAVEFKLHDEPHYMVALSTAPLDQVDRQLLSLIAAMFIVLKLVLDE